jgi:hypothetical protein
VLPAPAPPGGPGELVPVGWLGWPREQNSAIGGARGEGDRSPRMMPLLAPAPWHIGAVTTRDAAPGLYRPGGGFMIEVVGLGTPLCERLGMERPAFARAGAAAGPDLVAAVPNAGRSGGVGAAGARQRRSGGGGVVLGRPGPLSRWRNRPGAGAGPGGIGRGGGRGRRRFGVNTVIAPVLVQDTVRNRKGRPLWLARQ